MSQSNRLKTLREAGYPERIWEPSGEIPGYWRDMQWHPPVTTWASREATREDWERRWEEYQAAVLRMEEKAA